MASSVNGSYACGVEVCGKGKKKGVHIETNANKNKRKGGGRGNERKKKKENGANHKIDRKRKEWMKLK